MADRPDTSTAVAARTVFPPDHPLRARLAHEIHTRPFTALRAPARASHLALLSGSREAAPAAAHLGRLCGRYGVAAPDAGATHFEAELGPFRVKWERHTEFYTCTFFRHDPFTEPFAETALDRVPGDWLADLPGQVLVAVHVALETDTAPGRDAARLEGLFDSESIAGSRLSSGAAAAWTDFRIGPDGFSRFLVRDLGLRDRQAGRLVQRLLEIETYRIMALLAFPLVGETGPTIERVDHGLNEITSGLSNVAGAEDEQKYLDRLTRLAADMEGVTAATSYRFAAGRAYYQLVLRRIAELREQRIEGLQTIGEFMDRRLAPAMRTCEAAAARNETLSERVARASNLLRTRVDVALEAQNRDLLRSMNRRAKLQLRLQETVEGLSVAAISYYLVGLIGYGLAALAAGGLPLDVKLLQGLSIPLVVLIVWLGLRRVRRHLVGRDGPEA